MTTRRALTEHIAGLELVDNHVHGFWPTPVDQRHFDNGLNEANTAPLADFDSGFDTQLGFAMRAHCAPLLGLPPHADPQDYWAARRTHTARDLARIFLSAAGVCDWLVDTGVAGLAGVMVAKLALVATQTLLQTLAGGIERGLRFGSLPCGVKIDAGIEMKPAIRCKAG